MDHDDLTCVEVRECLWPNPAAAGTDARVAAARAHLGDCPTCRCFFAIERALDRRLARLRSTAVSTNPELYVRVCAQLDDRVRQTGRRTSRRRAFVFTALAAAAVFIVMMAVRNRVPAEANALIAAATRTLPADSVMDSSDSAGVARWLEHQAGMPLAIPAIAGAQLMGGRVVRLANQPVVGVVYHMHGVPLIYLAAPTMQLGGMTVDTARAMVHMGAHGYQVAVWGEADGARAIVAPMSSAEVHTLATECHAMLRGTTSS